MFVSTAVPHHHLTEGNATLDEDSESIMKLNAGDGALITESGIKGERQDTHGGSSVRKI